MWTKRGEAPRKTAEKDQGREQDPEPKGPPLGEQEAHPNAKKKQRKGGKQGKGKEREGEKGEMGQHGLTGPTLTTKGRQTDWQTYS